jgi:hypothetical protein
MRGLWEDEPGRRGGAGAQEIAAGWRHREFARSGGGTLAPDG